jgi:hypothetical protein
MFYVKLKECVLRLVAIGETGQFTGSGIRRLCISLNSLSSKFFMARTFA